jgi:secondary thiamine-phosphate synthase enzyme
MVRHYKLSVGQFPKGFHIITQQVFDAVPHWPKDGMMHVFIQHTSAGLSINENADITVRQDFGLFFERLAPEHLPGIQHDMEGPDDMPAHIKSTLTGSAISIPIIDGIPALGTWQGIFLCEFRTQARRRDLIISIIE